MNSLKYRVRKFSNSNPLTKPFKYWAAERYHNLFLKLSLKSPKQENYKVLGLRRSGNHGIILWILNHKAGMRSFCNDLSLNQPIESAPIKKSRWGSPFQRCIIYSYEDLSVNQVFSDQPDSCFQKIITNPVKLLILRDPYNLFSSWMAWESTWGERFRQDKIYQKKLIEHWKNHAREFIEESQTLPPPKICINYNSWVCSENYRKLLAQTLQFKKEERKMSTVPSFGLGSSFDALDFEHEAQRMKVMERWKLFSSTPFFQTLKEDEELTQLSLKIFGAIIPDN